MGIGKSLAQEHAEAVVAKFDAAIDRLIPECSRNLAAAFEPLLPLPDCKTPQRVP